MGKNMTERDDMDKIVETVENGRDILAEYGILQLAYLGDAVMELAVRQELLRRGNFHPGHMVKLSKAFVTCEAQSDAAERLLPCLTPEEEAVYRRGRNAKTKHTPSHGDPIQYRRATGLEALFGYLELAGRRERMRELFEKAYDGVAEEVIAKIL